MKNDSSFAYKLMVLMIVLIMGVFCIPTLASSQITVTKEWNDNLTGTSANNRANPTVVSAGSWSQTQLLDMFYPVDCIFLTYDEDFNPNNAWGGTWELESEGSALISGSKNGNYRVGSSYGSNSVSYTPVGSVDVTVNNHTLTVNEIPSHTHQYKLFWDDRAITSNATGPDQGKFQAAYVSAWSEHGSITHAENHLYYTGGDKGHNHIASGSFTGTATTLNNMQKSKAVYIWHRTA